ncbi:MAG: SLBB domain-containing protein [Deltaproteobacteria bacterium]|nr:SLBB domain-containing protein [Deltaproteobacteria bacterium]MBW2300772.1 SLBB domain-containing protein [Deltaproteobacteria bacterium]
MKIRISVTCFIAFLMLFSLFSLSPRGLLAQETGETSAFTRIKQQFSGLSTEEKVRKFGGLSPEEKTRLFNALTDREKVLIFQNLSTEDRQKIFSELSDDQKEELFKSIGTMDQEKLFKALSEVDKRKMLQTMSEAEQEEWLAKFPELEPEKVPPPIKPPAARPRPAAEAPSSIEKIMSGQFPTDISRNLKQFGYDFFNKQVSTFAPLTNVPVGPDYVIGPGDNFTIHLWGKAEETYNVSVNRDGCIYVPRVGTLNVSGLTFSELRRYLMRKFKEYYPAFEMSLTMGRLRTIQVFIVGEARTPGTYSLSSLSTIITALFEAGGPTKNGSLRDIRLFRNGKVIKDLDLYEFFIKGFKGNDVRLQSGDTIFIPVLGPVVGIAGCVRRPAIYEMKGSQTIAEMIAAAGGVLPLGYLQNVVVERITGHERRVIRSFNLDPSYSKRNENMKIRLKDGDVVKIYPIYKKLRQVVYLEGHVKYPREYELKPGMRLRDIIPGYDALLPEPYRPQAEIVRLVPPDLHPEIIGFNLGRLLAGDESQNLPLQDLDRVIVYNAWEKQEKPLVTIKGSVRNPGTYRLYRGMTVKDLIFEAGNLTDRAYKEKASLTRVVTSEKGTDIVKLTFSPARAMKGMPSDNLLLQKDDIIHIREIPQYAQALERKAYLEGEFRFPGEYTFSQGERLSSLIERAGGLTEDAYPFGAIFERESVKKVQDQQLKKYREKLEQDILTMTAQAAETAMSKEEAGILQESLAAKKELLKKLEAARSTGRMVINLPEVLALPSSEYNFELRPGDRLVVKKKPDSVNVLGEVYNPTALLYEKGKSVGYYLRQVGGPTENAEKDQIYVVKANGAVISKAQSGFFGLATWDSQNYRWTLGKFYSMELDAGDTIIVPKKVVKYPWLRVTKDITSILYQIAVTAGVVIAAY